MAIRTTIREAQNGSATTGGSVVLLDEHPIWLDALERILAACDIRVVGKATAPETALELVALERPHGLVASIDLASSGMDGAEVLRRAREQDPELRMVALSTHDDPFHASTAANAGADAYLAKTANAAEVARTILRCLQTGTNGRDAQQLGEAHRPALTARELEIVQLVARGYTNVQIAKRLWVTSSTVKFHLVNAYRKLGVSNRTQAARYLFEHGLSDFPFDRSA